MQVKNIDNLLMNQNPDDNALVEPVVPAHKEPDPAEAAKPVEPVTPPANDEKSVETPKEAATLDEYGNPVGKPKLYTDEDVQRMVRERLARVKQQEPQAPQNPPNYQQPPANDADGENWEVQLEGFVEKTISKLSAKQAQTEWENRERQVQANFEDRFTRGLNKYPDFEKVVADKPISTGMMKAVRGMEDPAAFLYAAAKTQPQELARISQLPDAYSQAVEIGKLEERMRKTRAKSNSPTPPTEHSGDIPQKGGAKRSIDDLIAKDAQRMRKS